MSFMNDKKNIYDIGGIMDEIKENDIQIILSLLSIGTIIVSIVLLYNDSLEKENKLFDNKIKHNINFYNRIFIFIILLLFCYINYNDYIVDKNKGNRTDLDELQIGASILTLIAASIVVYIAYIKPIDSETIENPTI